MSAGAERDFETAFAKLVRLRAGGLVISNDPFFISRSDQLAALALRHAVPTAFEFRAFVTAGGLMSYGSNLSDLYRLAGVYGPYSQGREAYRSAGAAVDESRANTQPQNR